jgi:hypothetical protein
LQTELADALRVAALLSVLLRATALLFITTVARTKRPMIAKRAAFQVISIYMVCPPGFGSFLVRPRHHDPELKYWV